MLTTNDWYFLIGLTVTCVFVMGRQIYKLDKSLDKTIDALKKYNDSKNKR